MAQKSFYFINGNSKFQGLRLHLILPFMPHNFGQSVDIFELHYLAANISKSGGYKDGH